MCMRGTNPELADRVKRSYCTRTSVRRHREPVIISAAVPLVHDVIEVESPDHN